MTKVGTPKPIPTPRAILSATKRPPPPPPPLLMLAVPALVEAAPWIKTVVKEWIVLVVEGVAGAAVRSMHFRDWISDAILRIGEHNQKNNTEKVAHLSHYWLPLPSQYMLEGWKVSILLFLLEFGKGNKVRYI
jgi:hypothetical protein